MAGVESRAGGAMREAAQIALAEDWTLAGAVAVVAGDDVDQALAGYEAGLAPLAETEPRFDGDGAAAVRQWLKPIGMKIAPAMGKEVAGDWLSAVMMALSDFPAKVIVQATRSAIRVPMQYLNEVDGQVRAEAEKIMARHRTALLRLRQMQEAIRRAAEPERPALAPPEDGATPLSPAELRALTPDLRRIGLAQGWITQEQLEAADAEIGEAA